MQIEFVASVTVISADPAASRSLYVEALGLPLERLGGEYFASDDIAGSRHFGVWPLEEAAQACFGTATWPSDRVVPQVSVEFELASVAAVAEAAKELQGRGFTLLHEARTEPWGQTVARTQDRDGVLVGLSYAPWMHDAVT